MLESGETRGLISGIDGLHGFAHGQRTTHRALGIIVLSLWCTEYRQDGIPEKLVNSALMIENNIGHVFEVAIQQ